MYAGEDLPPDDPIYYKRLMCAGGVVEPLPFRHQCQRGWVLKKLKRIMEADPIGNLEL